MYVIGVSDNKFINVVYMKTMMNANYDFWDEVSIIEYNCTLDCATIFRSYEEASETKEEIQNRANEIQFRNHDIIEEIIDKKSNFDKAVYAKEIKIFELKPTLRS